MTPAAITPSEIAIAPTKTSLRVLVGGDLIPHRPRLTSPERIGEALAPLAPLFAHANAVIANYETATGDPRSIASLKMTLAATPEWMQQVADANVTALTIANNHACDLGERGLHATIDAAHASSVEAIGADVHEAWSARTIAEADGHRVCAVAWTTLVNEARPSCSRSHLLAVAAYTRKDRAKIALAIHDARARSGCDAVIAIFHGGQEYLPLAKDARDEAVFAAESGADAVVVHHPHVASPVFAIDTRDGRHVPIFASVGNLVSNQGESWKLPLFPVRENRRVVSLNAWTRLGVVADLTFAWTNAGKSAPSLEWGYHLVWTDNEHAIRRNDPMPKIATRVLDPESDRAIVDRLEDDSDGPIALFRDPCWIEHGNTRCR